MIGQRVMNERLQTRVEQSGLKIVAAEIFVELDNAEVPRGRATVSDGLESQRGVGKCSSVGVHEFRFLSDPLVQMFELDG